MRSAENKKVSRAASLNVSRAASLNVSRAASVNVPRAASPNVPRAANLNVSRAASLNVSRAASLNVPRVASLQVLRNLIIGFSFIGFLFFTPAYAQKRPQATYSCPMHAEVKAKKPGRCPKCGMDLRKVDHTHLKDTESEAEVAPPSKMNIPDVEVVDQNGRKLHFYTDLIKDKTVAINFIFTTCTTICPPLGATFARVQKELGDRGRDVRFISISVDPATDTPERLKSWGAKFHAGESWTFVTGDKPKIDELLRALGASSARREDHSPTILIGNDAHGSWTRTYGIAKTTEIIQLIDNAANGTFAKESN